MWRPLSQRRLADVKKKAETIVYFLRRDRYGGTILKADVSSGSAEFVNKYDVRLGKCTCEGYKYRGSCKHIKMLERRVEIKNGIEIEMARAFVRMVFHWIEPYFAMTLLDSKPYEKDENGIVLNIRIRGKYPVKPMELGKWEVRADLLMIPVYIESFG